MFLSFYHPTIEGEFVLEENGAEGLTVKVPYISEDDEGNSTIEHKEFKIEEGYKAKVIRQFFIEGISTIVRNQTAYNLESIILDEIDLPEQLYADIITD
jgi:hypothetical protein